MLRISENYHSKVLLCYGFKKTKSGYLFDKGGLTVSLDDGTAALVIHFNSSKNVEINCDVLYDLIKNEVVVKEGN